jgi:hypothetical protein
MNNFQPHHSQLRTIDVKGQTVTVDNETFTLITKYDLPLTIQGGKVWLGPQPLHRLIMRAQPGQRIYCVDGDWLNCTCSNFSTSRAARAKDIQALFEKHGPRPLIK